MMLCGAPGDRRGAADVAALAVASRSGTGLKSRKKLESRRSATATIINQQSNPIIIDCAVGLVGRGGTMEIMGQSIAIAKWSSRAVVAHDLARKPVSSQR